MDHFPRFRRKKEAATPAIITSQSEDDTQGKTPVSPSPVDSQLAAPHRSSQKLSPFRVLHRISGKRARDSRDSPPTPSPQSPNAPPTLSDATAEHPISPLSQNLEKAGDKMWESAAPEKRSKMPQFLELSPSEIQLKYIDLVWLERERTQQSRLNPSPDSRWAGPSVPQAQLKRLDRYANIQPWDKNRVKLRVPDGHLDYINASPIVLVPSTRAVTHEPHRYIAMQGPKTTSTDHVWRMVVEQLESPGVIVMLTETHEGNFEKCYQYFPRNVDEPALEINEHDEFGDGFRASVHCAAIEETVAEDAIELRKLIVRIHAQPQSKSNVKTSGIGASSPSLGSNRTATPEPSRPRDEDVKMKSPTANSPSVTDEATESVAALSSEQQHHGAVWNVDLDVIEERVVWHFLYKKWPDFGVPALEDIDSFFTLMRLSREKNASAQNPRIVHCSAGVGRSGTFIALEHLMRELEAGTLENYDEQATTTSPEEDDQSENRSVKSIVGKQDAGPDLIFNTVNKLREQRRTMVQAESQYLFIYQVLRKLWLEKYGSNNGDDEVGEPAAKRLEIDPFLAE